MKRLFAILLFCVLGSAGKSFALPPCPEDQNQRFHNCFGTYTTASGHKYVGEFKNNKYHGQGTYTKPSGDKYIGEFKDGKPWDSVSYSASGAVQGTFLNGKWCEGCKPEPTSLAPKLATLTVRSNPTYADVYINNAYKGKTVFTVEESPGYYSVRVEKDGYNSFQQGIQLKNDMDVWASLTKKEKPKPEPKPEPPPLKLIGTGTGFLVNKKYIVTAEHVVEDCNEVTVRHKHKEYQTAIAARDSSNDLGLLLLEEPFKHNAKLRGGKAIRLGERIATYGYPLFGELSDSAKITQGNINSLAGLGNDSRVIQFDAPTQPGNSGGPVLDSSGNVVGVVSHGLSKKYADQSGHIAQNVNFAVKSYLVEGFLASNNVSFEKAESAEELKLPDIADKSEQFTVLVGCWASSGIAKQTEVPKPVEAPKQIAGDAAMAVLYRETGTGKHKE